ncbi:DUF1868 domain-containing protein [Mesorhizobium sp. CAU 1741]|uniref:DUF1868 domain-containing protein n=1 Tax=Mesorhizobium sp. CAU 1741 TaxID=3140366 RepID=UPI00325AD13D
MAYATNDDFALHFTSTRKEKPPRYLGTRYDREGNFLYEPGNTFVSHVTDGSATQAAIVAVRERLMAMPHADHFTFTPVASLHKTLFQGVTDNRRSRPFWPSGLSCEARLETATSWMDARIASFSVAAPFRIKADMVTPLGIVVSGLTEDDERVMRDARDALADLLGYRHPDHEDYTFHITLAYQLEWLPPQCQDTYLAALDDIKAELETFPQGLELDLPAFCAFDDMKEFKPLRFIG